MFALAAHAAMNYLQNRTTDIEMHQKSGPKIPAGAHHHQKANVRKYLLKQHWYYTGNTKNKTKTFAARSFRYAAPTTWNSFPKQIRTCNNSPSLKHYLKLIITKKHSTLNKLYKPN